ncbi:MAG TPA: protein kinase, partial [Kofleriaceae bacterium]
MRDDEEEDVDLSDSRPTALPNDPDFPGHTVAGYVLDGEIGRGGMGVVYAATHPLIGKRVAIKVLSHELASDRVTLERFLLEARAVNAIGHPNIVDTFDFGILPDGRQYLVMDLLVGETLRTRLRRGPLSIGEASVIVDEIASALAAAHNKGIIHRDLKPDNVFIVVQLNRTPQIKLLDFGLVKLTATSTDGVERTRSGAIVGTPNYMSPEQARARGHLDHRTDIYALGVLTFEMIAGHLPYIRDNALDTLIAHVQEEIPSLHETVDRVPIELAQLVEAMMSKAPSDRPTLAAIRQVLKRMPQGDISMRVEFKTPKPIAPPQRTVADRPRASSRPGTPRPALEVPADIEHASSPAIPEPAYRSSPSSPAYVDEYQPAYDEDHTNVSVPPPPRPRAPTVPPAQRAPTPHPIRRDTPPMGTRARRESAPLPRLERPPTQPAPDPIEEEDLGSAWLPSNTDPTAVTPDGVVPPYPEMIRATSRAETAPPPTRAVTRPGELTPASGIPIMTSEGERPPLPSILARASSVSEHELPTSIGGEPLRDLESEPELTTSGAPPDEHRDEHDDEDFSSLAEPQRPHQPARRTAPRISTTNLHRPTEQVPSLAIPPPDFEPPSTWQNEAPTLVTPPELAAMLSPPDPTPLVDLDSSRSPSENDVITSAPRRSSPSGAPPLASEEPRVDRSYGEPDTPRAHAEPDAGPHAFDAAHAFDPPPTDAADEE